MDEDIAYLWRTERIIRQQIRRHGNGSDNSESQVYKIMGKNTLLQIFCVDIDGGEILKQDAMGT